MLQQIHLFGLCLLYLLTILLSGSLKYSLNLSKGLLAEAVLRRLRNQLGRDRMQEVRNLGQIIGENRISSYSKTARALRSIRSLQSIRIEIFRRKFLMKGLYNFATHLTPFFFYTIGGYLVIEQKLTFGALVAALAAHKDFSAPLKELFRYYQTSEDVRVRWVELSRLLHGKPDST